MRASATKSAGGYAPAAYPKIPSKTVAHFVDPPVSIRDH